MQCVILAAGEGKRMRPLTLSTPKPLIPLLGKPILAHIIDALPAAVTELILVVGYKREMIEAYFGSEYKGRPIRYVVQEIMGGTGDAIKYVEHLIHDRFLLLTGDDLHGAQALTEATHHPLSLIVSRHEFPERFGVVSHNNMMHLRSIEEKPELPQSNLVNTGAMVLDRRIFDMPIEKSGSGELYVTDAVTALARMAIVKVVEQTIWIPVGYPEDVPVAEKRITEELIGK